MAAQAQLSGQCLCGAVRFTATPENTEMGVCHCGMCRRWSGGAFMVVDCAGSVAFADESQLGVYSSSDWGERCFCKQCGTSLIWRMKDGAHAFVSAQAFEDPSAFALTHEIFIDEKPGNYDFANDTHKMTGAEVFEAFGSSESSP